MAVSWRRVSSPERTVPHTHLGDEADVQKIYSFGKKLGEGAFGVVYEATHMETQKKWAIKKVKKMERGSSRARHLEREVDILKRVNHKNIIHLEEVLETSEQMYLVVELCEGGELNQFLQKKGHFSEEDTKYIISSLAEATVYLHKLGIVHRDLKLENILVDSYEQRNDQTIIDIKITDFGLSVQKRGVGSARMMQSTCGTPQYMAPEVLLGHDYSQQCDVWSIGIIMYMLISGEHPFTPHSHEHLFQNIKKGDLKFSAAVWETVSDAAKAALICLLKVDPAYRITASELLDHPWITGDMSADIFPTNVLEMMKEFQNELQDEESKQASQETGDLPHSCSQDTVVESVASPESLSTPPSAPPSMPLSTPPSAPLSIPPSAPLSAPSSAPLSAPLSAPSSMPLSTPSSAPLSAPSSAPSSAPLSAPSSAPLSAPSSAPLSAPSSAPLSAPLSAPSSAPLSAPSSAPLPAPLSAPLSAPSSAPLSAPSSAPLSAPLSAPSSAPSSVPPSAPLSTPPSNPPSSPECPPVQTLSLNEELDSKSIKPSTSTKPKKKKPCPFSSKIARKSSSAVKAGSPLRLCMGQPSTAKKQTSTRRHKHQDKLERGRKASSSKPCTPPDSPTLPSTSHASKSAPRPR